jgi:hypothetical protein
MYIPQDKMLLAVSLLLEGNSIRSTMRIIGIDQNTIMKALVLAGDRCEKLMGKLRTPSAKNYMSGLNLYHCWGEKTRVFS